MATEENGGSAKVGKRIWKRQLLQVSAAAESAVSDAGERIRKRYVV